MSIECFSIHVNDALLAAENSDDIEMIDYLEEEEVDIPIVEGKDTLESSVMDEYRDKNKPASKINNTK